MAKVKELPLGVAYPGEDELNWVQKGGKVALEAGGTNLYFALGAPDDDESGAWLDGATAHPIKLTLLYFDVGTETIQIGYSSDASAEIGALETVVTKTDTGEWKRATYTLAASMRVGHEVYEDYGYADFRLTSSGLLILNEVRVRETALKVKAVWQASEFYIDESYEGTETDDVASEAITSGKIADDIQSDNYVLNTSGWKIWRNTGDAEFNNVMVRGTIYATLGQIGGFDIGADYVRDAANSFGLASTVTGGDDVRFWAGATFANRATAPLQLYESGYIFAKDIVLAKGSLSGASGENGYGYAVNPLFLCHFDGARPYESDYSGSVIGHLGQVGTYKYNTTETRGLFRKGKFGKAVQVAEATTNQVLNPSAETTANFAARGTATVTRDTGTFYLGATSYKIVLAAANDGIDLTTAALANAAHYVTFWASGSALSTLQVSADGSNWNAITQFGSIVQGATTWTYCGVSIASAQANGSTTTRIRNTASSGTFYIDAVQVEQKAYPTPYCDGSLGGSLSASLNGHSWSGTAHASASSRIVSSLTYPASGSINLAQGTISFWYFERGAYQGFPVALGVYIDANNYFNVLLQGYGGVIKPYCETKSGGSTVTAAYSNATLSGGWHHCVVTWTNGGSLKIYIDGTVGSITGSYVTPVGTPTNIEVGASNGVNLVDTWIDDLCILPIVLTDHEVKSIYYSDAPLMLAVNSQELRLSGAGLGDVFGNANGLFGRAADGTPSFGILNGTVNATTWGGASESFDSGDFMFGNNAASKANMVYDASTAQLKFRSGTTVKSYVDTDGSFTVIAAAAAADVPVLKWKTSGGVLAGIVSAWIDTANDLGIAGMTGYATSTGDVGYAQIMGVNYAGTKYAYAQIKSGGEMYVNLQSGKNTGDAQQRFRIGAAHSGSGTSSETLTIESSRSSGSTAAGFGSKINFYADNASAVSTYQGGIESAFTGGTTNSNITIAATNEVHFYHGGGAPAVTGSRGGNAALASLLTKLANLGLITDSSS